MGPGEALVDRLRRMSTAVQRAARLGPAALVRPPLDPPYRLVRLWPVRRSPLRFTEDPREWDCTPPSGEAGLLPSWRSLRRAKRNAVGTVIYSRHAFRLPEPAARREWVDVRPVAYRASLDSHWVTDWSALDTTRRHRTRSLDEAWEDFLDDTDRDFLEVMRFAHGKHRRGERIRHAAASLLGDAAGRLPELVDEGWVRAVADENLRYTYEVSIGSGTTSDLVGEATGIREGEKLARQAIDEARDLLAASLAKAGGLAAELASSRPRWPDPQIHFVPQAVDRAAAFDRLRRLYEELLDAPDEDDRG